MGFPRQEHWSGLPFLSPGDLPDLGIEPGSPALIGGFFFTVESPGEPHLAGWRYLKWWSESSKRTTEKVLTYLTQKWKCVSLDLRLLGARSFMHLAGLQKLSYRLFSDIDIPNLRGPGPSNQEGGTLQEPEELTCCPACCPHPTFSLSFLLSRQASYTSPVTTIIIVIIITNPASDNAQVDSLNPGT